MNGENKMADKSDIRKRKLRIGRQLSQYRISAYECAVNSSDEPVTRGAYIRGWYGIFDEHRLQNEIMPKLSEYVGQGYSYPILITSHRLASKTAVEITPPKDLKFHHRNKESEQTSVAVVLSLTMFKLL